MKYFFVLLFLMSFSVSAALAEPLPVTQCDLTSEDCFTRDDNKGSFYYAAPRTVPQPFNGARLSHGTVTGALDLWEVCRYLTNANAESYFVPLRLDEEWYAFLAHPPTGVTYQTCARPLSAALSPDNRCTNPQPAAQTVFLPYDPTGTSLDRTVQFSCTSDATDCKTPPPPWTETVTATFLALNSDVVAPSWRQTRLVYGGNPPPKCVPASCGEAVLSPSKTAPDQLLCSQGLPSEPALVNNTWTWQCTSVEDGASAECSALVATDGHCGTANGKSFESAPATDLCSKGNPSPVKGNGPWTWTCSGANGGSDEACDADKKQSCLDQGQSAANGQNQCPTQSCFFQVSGGAFVSPAVTAGIGFSFSRIGETDAVPYNGFDSINGQAILTNLVGPGDYPTAAPADLYINIVDWKSPNYPLGDESFIARYPFSRAVYYIFDGLVIGQRTRVTLYQGPNFTGPVLLDVHGPYLLEDSSYNAFIGLDLADWSSFGPLYAQFTPDTRHVSPQSMHYWGRGGSVKVTCDP